MINPGQKSRDFVVVWHINQVLYFFYLQLVLGTIEPLPHAGASTGEALNYHQLLLTITHITD